MREASTLRKVVLSSTFATGLVLATPQMADAALGDQTLRTGAFLVLIGVYWFIQFKQKRLN